MSDDKTDSRREVENEITPEVDELCQVLAQALCRIRELEGKKNG